MAFDAGSIEAEATIDTEPFQLALVRMDAEARKFADKSYKATAGADTAEGERKVKELKGGLDEIAHTDARAKVKVDGADHANVQLDELLAKMDLLKHSSATGSGFSGGRGGGSSSSSFLGGLASHAPSGIALGLGLAATTITPLLGVAAGLGASLVTPITAATIGIGAFGLAAKSSISKVETDVKTLTGLQQKYNAATSDKTRAAAHLAELKFWNSLSKPQQQAVTNVHQLSANWTAFQTKLQPEIFPLIAGGVKLLSVGLTDLAPVAKAAGGALLEIESGAGKALSSPFFHNFFTNFLPAESTKAITSFGTALGNLVGAGAHLVEDFAPLGHGFEGGLDRLTKRFEDWTEGKGPSQFVAWVHKNSPQIEKDVGQIAKGVTSVATALVPVGTTVLKDVGAVAGAIGKFSSAHPGDIKRIGEALLVVATGMKAIEGAAKVVGILEALQKIAGAGGAAGAGGLAEDLGLGAASGGGAAALAGATPALIAGVPAAVALAGTYGISKLPRSAPTASQAGRFTGFDAAGLAGKVGSQQVSSLKAAAKATDSVTISTAALNKQLGLGVPLGLATIGNADHLARSLLAQGEPLDEVTRKVDTYVNKLLGVPGEVHSHIVLDGTAAVLHDLHAIHLAIATIGNAAVSVVLPGGGRLQRAGGAPTGHHGKLQSGHPTVVGPLAHSSHLPGWLTGEGSTSPNATSSSGGSSGGSSSTGGSSSQVAVTHGLDAATKAIIAAAKAEEHLLNQQEAVTARQLATARGHLASLRGDASGVRSGALSSFRGLGDLGQIAPGTSVKGIISVLGQQDKVGAAFARNLGILRKKGLDDAAYIRLLNAGPGAVGQEVAELATATRGQIATINTDEARLGRLGRATGHDSAQYLFGAPIKAATADVHRLAATNHELVSLQRQTTKTLGKIASEGDKVTHQLLGKLVTEQHATAVALRALAGVPKKARDRQRTKVSR